MSVTSQNPPLFAGDAFRADSLAARRDERPARAMHVAPNWAASLREVGLADFDAIMTTPLGRTIRRLPERDNVRLELPTGIGPVRAYLKRHRGWHPFAWMRQLVGRSVQLAGTYEAEQIRRLDDAGVRNMELIACGQRLRSWGRGESFVLVREVPDAIPLDALLKSEFRGHRGDADELRLRRLIAEVATIARRFHEAGFNHQDLYCCHFLVQRAAASDSINTASEFAVHLIDLQRVQHRRRWRHRWIVKDLGQLNYSAPAEVISVRDRVRFLKAYLGIQRLGPAERRLIRQVLAKTRQIGRHDRGLRGAVA